MACSKPKVENISWYEVEYIHIHNETRNTINNASNFKQLV